MKHTFQLTIMAAGLLVWLATASWAQNLSIPNYLGRAGTDVTVPLEIDDASGLATFRVTVNFDRNILEPVSIQTGPLGSQFGLVWEHDDGVLDLFLARDEALVSGSGRLVFMTFRVNEGAETILYSDLTIANLVLGDQSSVVAVERVAAVSGTGGRLTVTDSATIDNAGNGLPDEWELANGLDPFTATADGDPDGDGVPNSLEAQLGLDPMKVDSDGDGYPDWSEYIAGTSGTDGNDYFSIKEISPATESLDPLVFYWDTVTGRTYRLLYGLSMTGNWDSATQVLQTPGDGQRKSYTNESSDGTGFFRLTVGKP